MPRFQCRGCGRIVPSPPPSAAQISCARCGGVVVRSAGLSPVLRLGLGLAMGAAAIHLYLNVDWQALLRW